MSQNQNSVLIVEDNELNRKILLQQLEQQGHSVIVAENGHQALQSIDANEVDLILLDILMPEMDGFQVLERLKAEDKLMHIPIIVISALDDLDSVVKCIELGADDFITKPFNQVLLKAKVNTSLEKKRLRDLEQSYILAAKRQTEVALEETEALLQTVVSNAPLVLFAVDCEGIFLLSEGKGLEVMGLKQDEAVGKNVSEIYKSHPMVLEDLNRALAGGVFTTIREIDGVIWETYYDPTLNSGGDVTGVIGISFDITERRHAEEERERLFQEISKSRTRLQAISARLVEVQEEERRSIARELHDEIGQTLTGLKISIEMGLRALGSPEDPSFKEAQNLVDELLAFVREMSLNLRPAMLDDLGLLPALLWHFERYTSQTNIQVDFNHLGLNKRFDPKIETAIYRIIQEALTNVARYAEIEQVKVRLNLEGDFINIEISDGGTGFDLDTVLSKTDSTGIAGLIERIDLLGGEITINTSPGKGTDIKAVLPLEGIVERRKKPR